MRPTTGTMLQQNNNNNYPCLNVSSSTREMLQKCSRASLPFPSRLELGLGDLPLIRGLRAWALCSKNGRKPGGLLGGGQAPTAPPAGRGSSASCPRPADVYLSGEWGRMGYGLPLGLDTRQAGIGALVTVATLKTSEGNGKTQTQCLFLRTEKGSCLYSTAKPGTGVTAGAASGVVRGWLRGKTGGGGRETPVGHRDNGPTPLPAQAGPNRVRVRSGRRWRKSGNAAGREKTGASRERQQRSSGEDPAVEITVEERQEEPDKGCLDCKQFPSTQQDCKRARQEREGGCRSPRCCHNASAKTSTLCGRREEGGQEEQEEVQSPRRSVATGLKSEMKGMRREEEEEEKKESLCLDANSIPATPNPELESELLQPHSRCDIGEMREHERNMEAETQTTFGKDSGKERNTNSEETHTGNTGFYFENPGEETVVGVNGFSDHVGPDQESERKMEDTEESLGPAPAEPSVQCVEYMSASISAAVPPTRTTESSPPVDGSICSAEHDEACCVQSDNKENLEGYQQGDPGSGGKDQINVCKFEPSEHDRDLCGQLEEAQASPPALRHKDPSIIESMRRILSDSESPHNRVERRNRLVSEDREVESEEENIKERVNPEVEDGDACNEQDDVEGKGDDDEEWYAKGKDDDIEEDNCGEVKRKCSLNDDWGLQESEDGELNGETGADVTNTARADPSTSPALSEANPAPSLPPLGSMATGLPRLEAAEGQVAAAAGDRGGGGQEGKRRHRRELEAQEEEQNVAAKEGRKEEEEEDEFGVFMQAEGEPAWSKGITMSASVPCGSGESVALGNHAITRESTHWAPSWTDGSFHQSDDTWTAFPQDLSDGGGDVAGQWWLTSAVEDRKDDVAANHNLIALFSEAFPPLPDSSTVDPCDLDTIPTLTQLLRGRAIQDQGLLDSFHDLNKMIGQRYKRANGVSRDLLLKTLQLESPHTESRPVPWTTNRRLSPGLPSANQHTQNAAAKRRLSYDYNRNIME